jgi:hypothetical protein
MKRPRFAIWESGLMQWPEVICLADAISMAEAKEESVPAWKRYYEKNPREEAGQPEEVPETEPETDRRLQPVVQPGEEEIPEIKCRNGG